MSDKPIYVKLRNDQGQFYGSYSVMNDLVDVSGLPWIDQTEFNIESPGLFLVPAINGNTLAWARDGRRKCRLVAYQIERWLTTADDFAPTGFDELWVADRHQARQLKDRPYVRYVPVGSNAGIGKPPTEKRYDLAPLAYIYGRRAELIHEIRQQGWTIAPSAFNPERDKILSATRCGLSVHQHNGDPSYNPLRSCIFSAFKLPQIFEYVKDPYPISAYSLSEIGEAMSDPRGYAEKNFKVQCEELEFRSVIERAARGESFD